MTLRWCEMRRYLTTKLSGGVRTPDERMRNDNQTPVGPPSALAILLATDVSGLMALESCIHASGSAVGCIGIDFAPCREFFWVGLKLTHADSREGKLLDLLGCSLKPFFVRIRKVGANLLESKIGRLILKPKRAVLVIHANDVAELRGPEGSVANQRKDQ